MTNDAQTIVDTARLGAIPSSLKPGTIYTVATANGDVKQIDLTGDQYRDFPARIRQTVHLTHADSLLAYWDKHSDPGSEVYADRQKCTITAILDAHFGAYGSAPEPDDGTTDEEFRPRWQAHRAVLELTLSDPLKAWMGRDNRYDDQAGFAEFIEDWLPYIVAPDSADLLEMVQTFQATTRATFKSAYKLVNGQRQLEYTEQVDATMRGDAIVVPTGLVLHMPIWRGAADGVELTARLRYRVNHGGPGQLGIGFKLDRPGDVIDAAFEAEVAAVAEHVGRPVLRGTPAGGA